MNPFIRTALGALLAAAACVPAHATVSPSLTVLSNTVALRTLSWTDTLSVAKFDPSLGTLTGVRFELFGEIRGDAGIESDDSAPSLITLTLAADLTLQRPSGTALVVATPLVNDQFQASASDGDLDFAGTSGHSFLNLGGQGSNMTFSSAASDLALFSGPGTITMPLVAVGTSGASGSGNLDAYFATRAGSHAAITYFYAPVPEPGNWALMLAGLGLVGWLTARRRA